MAGCQDFVADPRNASLLISINGDLVPRDEAKISVFDAGFSMGDGVWEGIRVHQNALAFLDAHFDRLYSGAAAIGLDVGLDRAALELEIWRCLNANGMTDGGHVRLMVTRGVKSTINQDPRNALGRATIVIYAEYKTPPPMPLGGGLALRTVSIRCTPAHMFDMRINSHSRLNLIMALLEAIRAGGDEALMLDPHGHVSSCNATNFFFVRDSVVHTSTGEYCFNGITRGHVIDLCHSHGIPVRVGDFDVEDAREADEAFVTGTTGGLAPVRRIDDAPIAPTPGPLTQRLAGLYLALKDADAARRARP